MKRRRLSLNRETLRTLDSLQMQRAGGGASDGNAQGTGCFIDHNHETGGTGGGGANTSPTDPAGCTFSALNCQSPQRSAMCLPSETC